MLEAHIPEAVSQTVGTMGGRNVPVRSTDIIASRNISEKTNMKMVSVENLMRLIHLRQSPKELGKRGQESPRRSVKSPPAQRVSRIPN